jgi:hypothetical protein
VRIKWRKRGVLRQHDFLRLHTHIPRAWQTTVGKSADKSGFTRILSTIAWHNKFVSAFWRPVPEQGLATDCPYQSKSRHKSLR